MRPKYKPPKPRRHPAERHFDPNLGRYVVPRYIVREYDRHWRVRYVRSAEPQSPTGRWRKPRGARAWGGS